jgi:hypothetical protein
LSAVTLITANHCGIQEAVNFRGEFSQRFYPEFANSFVEKVALDLLGFCPEREVAVP